MKTIRTLAAISIEDNKILIVQNAKSGLWACPNTRSGEGRDEVKLVDDLRVALGADMKITGKLGDFDATNEKGKAAELSVFVVKLLGGLNIHDPEVSFWRYMDKVGCESENLDPQTKTQVIPACVAKGLLQW